MGTILEDSPGAVVSMRIIMIEASETYIMLIFYNLVIVQVTVFQFSHVLS